MPPFNYADKSSLLRFYVWQHRHGHKFQFFCKYYAAMMLSLCGCIILGKDIPVIQEWSPLYVMITVIVVMSEKVDTTITKGMLLGWPCLLPTNEC